jgi:uncharacterized membrane protein YbhN (UPF0104 family)
VESDAVEPDIGDEGVLDEEMPRLRITRRTLVVGVVFILAALAFLYWGIPRLAGLEDTWERIEEGNPWWLAAALAFTVLSFGGYVVLFQFVFVRAGSRIDLRASYQITMAGLAATRIFAAGGAGGLALTAWALRRSGMGRRQVADSTVAFIALTYVVYMGALIVCGLLLYFGVLSGDAPVTLTLVPAILAAVILVVATAMSLVPTDFERRLADWATQHHRPRLARVGGAWPPRRQRSRRGSARRCATCAAATRRCSARSRTGASTSRCCGRASTRSARRRRGASSSWATSSGCSATCCPCRAASAASTAG